MLLATRCAAPAILASALSTLLLCAPAQAQQVTFTPPAGAPTGGVNLIGVREVYNNGSLSNQGDARTSLTSGTGTIVDTTTGVINFYDSDRNSAGHFVNDQRSFFASTTGGPAQGSVDNLAAVYQGKIFIPTTGAYTFGINSDDGFTLAFDNGSSTFSSTTNGGLDIYNGVNNGAFQYYSGRGAADSFGVINLSAGVHSFNLTYHEGGGGSGIEFFAAPGTFTSFTAGTFRLVGQQASAPKLTTLGTWDYYELHGNATSMNSLAKTFAAYNTVRGGGTVTDVTSSRLNVSTLNFIDPQGENSGTHGNDAAVFPGNTGGDDDFFGGGARIQLQVSAANAGHFSFITYADDGLQFRILDSAGNPIPETSVVSRSGGNNNTLLGGFTTNDSCCQDDGGIFNLAAGTYTLEAVFNEQTGGSAFFVYGGMGDHTTVDAGMELVGLDRAAGLQIVPEPTSLFMLGAASLGALGLMRRRRRA